MKRIILNLRAENVSKEEQEIIDYIKNNKLDIRCRKREILDPRNFLVSILYHKFGRGEDYIGYIINKDHSTVNHCKDFAYHLRNDPQFQENTKEVRKVFSYWTPPIPQKDYVKSRTRKIGITMMCTPEEVEQLEKLKKKIKAKTSALAAKDFIFLNINQVI